MQVSTCLLVGLAADYTPASRTLSRSATSDVCDRRPGRGPSASGAPLSDWERGCTFPSMTEFTAPRPSSHANRRAELFVAALWMIAVVAATIQQGVAHQNNNFLIFRAAS